MIDVLNELFLLALGLGFVAWRACRKPRGAYLRSAIAVLAVALGWAAIWLVASPANETGFGFFAIWVVVIAVALLGGSPPASARPCATSSTPPRGENAPD